ncbi:RidA family protein [Croceicoccus sp. BE223]|uniref:RidA family protein n=1 Tax=Croceicoccus sp. BE223 TaxID=2817716 RepID=UPI0028648DDD|nr:RidA family protein [Croceicoccus sp. BE223]MDR7101614.1 reactive intermediate/imine deaminase [Croceicoccus sp. BE223]
MAKPEPIVVPDSVPPAGHYSAGMRHGGLLYVSGQLGARADGSHTHDQPFEVQVRAALDNVLRVLGAGGCTADDLVKVTVYLVGVENWPPFNAIYADVMGDARPARAVVPVPELHYGYLVEIEAIAACRDAD